MKGDGKYILVLVFVGGLLLEAAGLPALKWVFSAVGGWFGEIPDLHSNTTQLLGDLAWPIATIILALLFRDEILRILRSIKRVTWGDKVVDLSADLDAVEKEVAQTEGAPPTDMPVLDDRLARLIEISPAAAILEAWKELEATLRRVVASHGPKISRAPTARMLIEYLFRQELIGPSDHFALTRLADIRNKAVHDTDVTSVTSLDAYRFIDSARILGQSLNKLAEENDGR